MNKFNDNSPKYRLLAILKALLELPYFYTRKMLATRYNVSPDTIKKDFEELRDADFNVKIDGKYRYAIVPNKSLEHLEDVLFFSESEKDFLLEALIKPMLRINEWKRCVQNSKPFMMSLNWGVVYFQRLF